MSGGETMAALPEHSILIDGRPLQSHSSVRGIGTYVRGLLTGLSELGVERQVDLLLRHGPVPSEVGPAGVAVARHRIPMLHPTLQPTADLALITWAVQREKPRLFHGVEWGHPLISRVPSVVTVHDLVPFVFPRHYPWVRRARVVPLAALRAVHHVIAISDATARDLQRLAHINESRITVVHEGVSAGFRPATQQDVASARERLGIGTRRFVLGVGTFEPRKRPRLLADAVRRIRQCADVDLVVAGDQGKFGPAVRTAADASGISDNTRLVGHVSPRDLVALYTACECMLFTSAYEGFGLPPLEAMACGAPVVMFDNSSLPEIAGPAILVRDGDAAAMAEAGCRLIDETRDRESLVVAGRTWAASFTWRRSAEQTLEVYARALGQA